MSTLGDEIEAIIFGEEDGQTFRINNFNSDDPHYEDLFVRMISNVGDFSYCWYKLSEEEEEEESGGILSPCFKLTHPICNYQSTQVAVGPYIVVIGGTDLKHPQRLYKFERDVYVMDTRKPDDAGWMKGPKLLSSRLKPYAFVLANTLCVFGGTGFHSHPIGEVLDLQTGIWKIFKTSIDSHQLPHTILGHGVVMYNEQDMESVDDGGKDLEDLESEDSEDLDYWYEYNTSKCQPYMKDLYLRDSTELYSYNFDTSKFKLIEFPDDQVVQTNGLQSASANDFLYVMCYNLKLRGYSMSKGIWFEVCFCKQQNDDWDPDYCFDPFLVHLGNGLLCILCVNSESSTNLLVHCIKFTVKVEEDEFGKLSAAAEIKFFKTYNLPPGKLVDCVAVSAS